MAVNAFALYEPFDEREMVRWGGSAAVMIMLHAALVALALIWLNRPPEQGATLPAILVDMAPMTSAPQSEPLDLAPGPTMQEADASPPEPVTRHAVEEELAPTPPQEKPEVAAPPERKPEPSQAKPEPAQPAPEQKPTPVKPRVVRRDAKRPSDAMPAPRTAAMPRTEHQAPAASADTAGASAAMIRSYNQLVAAHLQRFKQYPAAARSAGQQGVASVSFSLGRGGAVLSARLARSSGNALFDAEVVAMVRRAQPFPAFPSDIKTQSLTFQVPIAFSIR